MHSLGLVILERYWNRQFVMIASAIGTNTERRHRMHRDIGGSPRTAWCLCSDTDLDNSSTAPSRKPAARIKGGNYLRVVALLNYRAEVRLEQPKFPDEFGKARSIRIGS